MYSFNTFHLFYLQTYCYAILNHELLDIIVQHLERALEDPNLLTDWRRVDSYLYAFYAISENAICSDDPRILQCILLLEKLPLANMDVQISQTVMELLGRYSLYPISMFFCSFFLNRPIFCDVTTIDNMRFTVDQLPAFHDCQCY